MEAGSQHAEGLVKFRGQNQDEKGLLKGKPSVQQSQTDLYRHHRGADGGDHFQDQRG